MAYTDEEIDAKILTLENELLSVDDTVQFGDRMVRKKTTQAIRESLEYFKRLKSASARARSKQSIGVASSGF